MIKLVVGVVSSATYNFIHTNYSIVSLITNLLYSYQYTLDRELHKWICFQVLGMRQIPTVVYCNFLQPLAA